MNIRKNTKHTDGLHRTLAAACIIPVLLTSACAPAEGDVDVEQTSRDASACDTASTVWGVLNDLSGAIPGAGTLTKMFTAGSKAANRLACPTGGGSIKEMLDDMENRIHTSIAEADKLSAATAFNTAATSIKSVSERQRDPTLLRGASTSLATVEGQARALGGTGLSVLAATALTRHGLLVEALMKVESEDKRDTRAEVITNLDESLKRLDASEADLQTYFENRTQQEVRRVYGSHDGALVNAQALRVFLSTNSNVYEDGTTFLCLRTASGWRNKCKDATPKAEAESGELRRKFWKRITHAAFDADYHNAKDYMIKYLNPEIEHEVSVSGISHVIDVAVGYTETAADAAGRRKFQDSSVWAISGASSSASYGRLYKRTASGWAPTGALHAISVAVDSTGRPWVINNDNRIYRANDASGSRWTYMAGHGYDIAAGPKGSVWIVGLDYAGYRHDGVRWVDGIARDIRRIDVDADGVPYALLSTGSIWKASNSFGGAWDQLSYEDFDAKDIAVTGDGTLWITDSGERVFLYDEPRPVRNFGRKGYRIAGAGHVLWAGTMTTGLTTEEAPSLPALMQRYRFDENMLEELSAVVGQRVNAKLSQQKGVDMYSKLVEHQTLTFDGSGDYARLPHSAALNFPNDFTVSLWLKASQQSPSQANAMVMAKYAAGSGSYPFKLAVCNWPGAGCTGKLMAARWDGTHNPYMFSSERIDDDKWHHVAFTRKAGELTLYVDGKSQAVVDDTTTGASVANSADIALGGLATDRSWDFTGNIDHVELFDAGMDADQVGLLAESAGRPKNPGQGN